MSSPTGEDPQSTGRERQAEEALPHEHLWCQVVDVSKSAMRSGQDALAGPATVAAEPSTTRSERAPARMKLYYAAGACSLAAHIVAREAGLPLLLVRVDTKTHRMEDGTDFHEVNSRGYVPVLELHNGERLREGAVIVQFLADSVPQSALIAAAGTPERRRAQEWLNFIATEYHKQLIWLLRGGPEDVLSAQRAKVARVLTELDLHLSSQRFMMGSRFTVVDAYAFAITRWCELPRVQIDIEPYTHVRAFLARLRDRPAIQDALIAEGVA